jgi:hypothetical protein
MANEQESSKDIQIQYFVINAVMSLVKNELKDYSELVPSLLDCKHVDLGKWYVHIEIKDDSSQKSKIMSFTVVILNTLSSDSNPNLENCCIEVGIGHTFYEIRSYDWSIKYFWLALLDWPF